MFCSIVSWTNTFTRSPEIDLHRCLRRVDSADHPRSRVIAVRLQDLPISCHDRIRLRRIERLYDPGDGRVVLVEHLHDPLVAL